MVDALINQVVRRRGFHTFEGVAGSRLTTKDVQGLLAFVNHITPLDPSIRVNYKIVDKGTNCNKGQDACILFYSEKKDNYLQNIGYIGMQIDLYCVSQNIGTLWCGMAKPEILEENGLSYVIMLCIKKVDAREFRKNPIEFDRRKEEDMWHGEKFRDFAEVTRLAPSACNSQPWYVAEEGDSFLITRISQDTGRVPFYMLKYFNLIDMGIFLCLLDIACVNFGYNVERELYLDNDSSKDEALCAKYTVVSKNQ